MSSGAGWGTIEDRRLRILLLGGPGDGPLLEGMARALRPRHDVALLPAARRGLFARLSAARAAAEIKPHIVHAVSASGLAASGPSIAAGVGAPLVASLTARDLEESPSAVKKIARFAAAVVLGAEGDADAFRKAGVDRELYVTAGPDADPGDADRFFLGAIEVVYGRVVATTSEAPPAPAEPADSGGERLVRIGPARGQRPG